MKRVLFTLALLACAPPSEVTSADAGKADAGAVLLLKVVDAPIVVLRGASTTVHVEVSNPFHSDFGPLTIATTQLPPEISTTTASWQEGDATTVSLTFTATSDASVTEIPIAIRAFANGKILASTPVILAVSGPTGVLDTSYGENGCMFLPSGSMQPSALRVLADGTIVVAGLDNGHVFVDRIAPDGTPTSSMLAASVTYLVAAIADDGRVAFATSDTSGSSVFEMTTSGATSSVGHFLRVTALAWDGDALFVATTYGVTRVSNDSSVDAPVSFSTSSLETIGSNLVTVAGVANNATVITTLAFDGSSLVPWSADVTVTQLESVTNTVTTASGTYVGVVGDVVGAFLVSYGAVVGAFTTGAIGWHDAYIAVPPGGAPLVFGTFSSLATSTTGVVQTSSLPFGANGHAYVHFGGDTWITAGGLDATASYLHVTGNVAAQNGLRGYVARVRLTSTP